MKNRKERIRSPYFLCDITAALLGVGLFVFFLFTAKNGVGVPDEGYYYTVAHRLALGEKMIADEWNLAQLVHLFNLLPNFLYMKLTGGTEGLILFMRYLFIAILAVFYGYTYIKLRRWKFWGVAAAFLFCAVVQQTLFTIAYFTVAPMAMLTVWMVLASDKKPSALQLTLAGFVLACGILAEPFLIALYLLWFVLALRREILHRKDRACTNDYEFLLSKRTFLWITLGAAILFFPYMSYLILSRSFEGIGAAIPHLATGAEYNKNNLVDTDKLVRAADLFGLPFLIGMLLILIAALLFRIKKPEDDRSRRLLLIGAGVLLAGSYIHAGIQIFTTTDQMVWISFIQFNNFMLIPFSAIVFVLSRTGSPRLFTLWFTGLAFSLLVDISSTVILASGGGLLRVACTLQLSRLLSELTPTLYRKKERKDAPVKQKSFFAALALCGVIALAWNGGYVLCETVYKPPEKLFLHIPGPLTEELAEGPFKGLRTTQAIADVYTQTLRDMDDIRKTANGRPVAVLDLAPYTYLYLDLPYGSYSAWYEFDEPERLAAYWELRPAQTPAIIYIPFYSKNEFEPYTQTYLQQKLERLGAFVQGDLTRGQAGYILHVQTIRTAEEAPLRAVN